MGFQNKGDDMNCLCWSTGMVLAMASALGGGQAMAATISATVIGDFQSELGCASDFNFSCALTTLTPPTNDQVWRRTLTLPGGNWNYKVALDGSADSIYPGYNLSLMLAEPKNIRFYYDELTNYVTDNLTSVIATLAGSFQSELGCTGDFDPSCLRSWLTDVDGDGILTYSTNMIPIGSYGVVVAYDENFSETYGPGGVKNSGQNILFDITHMGTTLFSFNSTTHILTIDTGDTLAPVPLPTSGLLLAGGLMGLALTRRTRRFRHPNQA